MLVTSAQSLSRPAKAFITSRSSAEQVCSDRLEPRSHGLERPTTRASYGRPASAMSTPTPFCARARMTRDRMANSSASPIRASRWASSALTASTSPPAAPPVPLPAPARCSLEPSPQFQEQALLFHQATARAQRWYGMTLQQHEAADGRGLAHFLHGAQAFLVQQPGAVLPDADQRACVRELGEFLRRRRLRHGMHSIVTDRKS